MVLICWERYHQYALDGLSTGKGKNNVSGRRVTLGGKKKHGHTPLVESTSGVVWFRWTGGDGGGALAQRSSRDTAEVFCWSTSLPTEQAQSDEG